MTRNVIFVPAMCVRSGEHNPQYANIFIFDNDFPALLPDVAGGSYNFEHKGLLVAESERGIAGCYVSRRATT